MTNHSESTGSSDNGDIARRDDWEAQELHQGQWTETGGHTAHVSHPMYDGEAEYGTAQAVHRVTLRSPDELADALPYLLGYRPEDSIVLVALHDRGGRGRFGGRARLGIPASPDDWGAVAQQLAEGLVRGSERRGNRPAQMVAYLCQDPARGETGRQVMERLKPLAEQLRLACGRLDIPVIEALCIADGRFWSYCCAGEGCCPVEGVPMGLPGTSVLAAAATYAGIQVRGTLRELRARLQPLETGAALEQEVALDTAAMELVPRILDDESRAAVAAETLQLAAQAMRRLAEAPVVSGVLLADHRDDELIGCDEAAALILGLQDRTTRDRAAEWMEGDEAAPALRLWRAVARRCVGPYAEHAAAPLTLAGWVAWSGGDELEAREAFAMALGVDPGYLFARLLHQACNEGLDPEAVRRCLRAERDGRVARDGRNGEDGNEGGAGGEADDGRGRRAVLAWERGTDGHPAPMEADRAAEPDEAAESDGAGVTAVPGGRDDPGDGGGVDGTDGMVRPPVVEDTADAEGSDRHDSPVRTPGSLPPAVHPTLRRRRRPRPTAVGTEPASAAEGGREGQGPRTHAPRHRSAPTNAVRPGPPSRAGSRTRPGAALPVRRQRDGGEGVRFRAGETPGNT
ncbi:DUF4192 domain-containing protein [Streptomyces sp. NPDC048481]|uniref:DUF4192 domain-containing protein n=1 Tax=Streptomyces sp. NPDC048481 TaxID=3365557 RepID=UPI00371C5DCA